LSFDAKYPLQPGTAGVVGSWGLACSTRSLRLWLLPIAVDADKLGFQIIKRLQWCYDIPDEKVHIECQNVQFAGLAVHNSKHPGGLRFASGVPVWALRCAVFVSVGCQDGAAADAKMHCTWPSKGSDLTVGCTLTSTNIDALDCTSDI